MVNIKINTVIGVFVEEERRRAELDWRSGQWVTFLREGEREKCKKSRNC